MTKITLLLLILLALEASVLISQGNITAQISPNSISTRPGEKIRLCLTVRNSGNVDINITSIRVHVSSKTLFGIPISIYLGEYPIPFEKPTRVKAGGEITIDRVVEVPNIPIAGDFNLELIVQTTGGTAVTYMLVSLSYSLLSLLALFVVILLISGILYLIYRRIRSGVSRRSEKKIGQLLDERDKYVNLLRKLEEKRARGEAEKEHEKLKDEYSSKLAEIQSKLDEAAKQLQVDVEKLSGEISKMEEDIKMLKARAELGELRKEDVSKIVRDKERLLMKKKEIISRKKVLLDRIKGV